MASRSDQTIFWVLDMPVGTDDGKTYDNSFDALLAEAHPDAFVGPEQDKIIPPASNKFLDPNHPFTKGLADIVKRYVDYYQTPGDILQGKYGYNLGQKSEDFTDIPGENTPPDEVRRRANVMAMDAMTGSIPLSKSGTLGSGGGKIVQFPPRNANDNVKGALWSKDNPGGPGQINPTAAQEAAFEESMRTAGIRRIPQHPPEINAAIEKFTGGPWIDHDTILGSIKQSLAIGPSKKEARDFLIESMKQQGGGDALSLRKIENYLDKYDKPFYAGLLPEHIDFLGQLGVKVDPKAWEKMLVEAPLSTNIEDRRNEPPLPTTMDRVAENMKGKPVIHRLTDSIAEQPIEDLAKVRALEEARKKDMRANQEWELLKNFPNAYPNSPEASLKQMSEEDK